MRTTENTASFSKTFLYTSVITDEIGDDNSANVHLLSHRVMIIPRIFITNLIAWWAFEIKGTRCFIMSALVRGDETLPYFRFTHISFINTKMSNNAIWKVHNLMILTTIFLNEFLECANMNPRAQWEHTEAPCWRLCTVLQHFGWQLRLSVHKTKHLMLIFNKTSREARVSQKIFFFFPYKNYTIVIPFTVPLVKWTEPTHTLSKSTLHATKHEITRCNRYIVMIK